MRTAILGLAWAFCMAWLSIFPPLSASADPEVQNPTGLDPFWKNATVYFMMTDRFANGDTSNDQTFDRKKDGAVLRNFMGGDIKGITQKIDEGYFDALGVNAIWMTPLNEQVHGYWDEDWGRSYAFHGYWPRDWTNIDPSYGTEADLKHMVETAHKHDIRILADVVINHTGPMTKADSPWPADWIRTEPICQWFDYANSIQCALGASLTDIKTEIDTDVALPPFLLEKWKEEGRLERELAELDAFFDRTGLARAPKNYIVKWLTDWVREYGIDGFRVDTAKHVEAEIWKVLKDEASAAFGEWKAAHPGVMADDRDFYMVGEVFEYGVDGFNKAVKGGRAYDYGDRKVDFFDFGFDALINMGFPTHAAGSMEQIFSTYSHELNGGPLEGVGIVNYVVSHDDPNPYDKAREHPFETANKLMLAPGAVQIYYGDELARSLFVDGTIGDATLRSFMNWEDLNDPKTQKLLGHWQKLGQFRKAHLSVGAGVHQMLNEVPYIFSRTLDQNNISDRVLVGIGLAVGEKQMQVHGLFDDGTVLKDYYSGQTVTVKAGQVKLNTENTIVLLAKSL